MQRIKTASHALYLFFRALCFIIPSVTAYLVLFHLDSMVKFGVWDSLISQSQIYQHDFSLGHRFIILLVDIIPLSITLLICHQLAKLFRLYEHGFLFEQDNIRFIKRIGLLMIAGEGVQLIYQPLITAALTFNNPVGERLASIGLGTTNATTLITGFIILIASWIVQEAHQLKTEVQLTI